MKPKADSFRISIKLKTPRQAKEKRYLPTDIKIIIKSYYLKNSMLTNLIS